MLEMVNIESTPCRAAVDAVAALYAIVFTLWMEHFQPSRAFADESVPSRFDGLVRQTVRTTTEPLGKPAGFFEFLLILDNI